jgi:class 3 adenylate cyclase/tetratricopeptide (TPR) repeat protein/ribosomal protein L40E
MRCSKCGSENPAGNNFCARCGNALARLCLKCGAENAPPANFCGKCGAALDTLVSTPVSPTPPIQPPEVAGERRHLTVLFCDLVGSTGIATRLDPEQWRETVAGYHRAAADAITRFDGHVAKYLGDGVMAYFGWPAAHDNDAERAARAGLALLDAIAKLNERSGHAKLSARVGIDSGTVVIGKGAGNEAEVFGDVPNIAARVQAAAEAGTVAITDATYRLVSGLFIVEDCGAQELKGIERPLQIYRVFQPSGVRGRFEAAAAAGGLTPFVGREDELRSLMNRWERALDGEGQVALIIGEAGIGKSRLVRRFHEQIVDTPHTWIEAGAGAFFQNTPFYPVTEMLRQGLFAGGNGPPDAIAQLAGVLTHVGLKPAEAIPLIAPLLDLALPAEYPPSTLSPEQQRRRLLATLVEWVLGLARAQPLVIAIEDLHWVDPSTLELIQLLVEQGATSRLLLLYTARPEFHAPWPLRAHHTQLTLNRLSARNVRTMVAQVAASKAMSDETVATVVERTGGVPLFVEELTRAVLESGEAKLTGREIPATLHDSLMARLDRLGPAKEVIQVGAVIGSEFSYELLRAVHPIGEAELQAGLRALTDAELLYIRGIAPDASYQFKHALIRDAAYEALLKSRRKELHRQVARTIDELFATLKETHPEVLARHWAEAGETELATAEWTRAAKVAQARNAFIEAQESYQQALALLNLLLESPERNSRELDLRQAVLIVLRVTRGDAAPETIAATQLVTELTEKIGDIRKLSQSAGAQFLAAVHAGNLSAAAILADKALDLALRSGSTPVVAAAYGLEVIAQHHCGDLVGTERNFSAWSEVCDDPEYGQLIEAKIATFALASRNAWMLGRADIAREREVNMMNAAIGGNLYRTALSSCRAAQLQVLLRDYQQAVKLAGRAFELAEKHQFPHLLPTALCVLGWARAEMGLFAEGIALIRQGIAAAASGLRLGITNFYLLLADAEHLVGAKEAFQAVEQALQANPEERECRPEALRIRGELRLKLGQLELAESDFRDSISLAQSMSAKSWELRATMSLARLLDNNGRRDDARAMLAEIYNWFTEGFDTADLKDAKALLNELAR